MDQEKKQQLIDLVNRMPIKYAYPIIKEAAEEKGVSPQDITMEEITDVISEKGINYFLEYVAKGITYGIANEITDDLLGQPESEMMERLKEIMPNHAAIDNDIPMVWDDQEHSQQEKDELYKLLIGEYIKRSYKLAVNKFNILTVELFEEWRRLASSNIFEYLVNDAYDAITINNIHNEVEPLRPYLETEIKNPEYHGLSLDDLINGYLDGDPEVKDLFIKALKAARQEKNTIGLFPKIQSIGTPKYYTGVNSPLVNALQDRKEEIVGAGPLFVQAGKGIEIYVDVTLENMDGIELKGKPYTAYDDAVLGAVASLVLDREKKNLPAAATAEMIYRIMTHKTDTEKVSPQQKGAITKSIEKMRKNIYVYADATEEMIKRKIITNPNGETEEDQHRLIIDDFLLSAAHYDNLGISGANTSGWIFNKPLVLQYAELKKELYTVNGQLLNIHKIDKKGKILPGTLSNNENRISVKNYLLKRIEIMRNDEKKARDLYRKYQNRRKKASELPEKHVKDFRQKQRTILFETVFEATGITNPSRKTEIREYVFNVLDYWRARPHDGISDYKKRKKGKTYDAVIIEI